MKMAYKVIIYIKYIPRDGLNPFETCDCQNWDHFPEIFSKDIFESTN